MLFCFAMSTALHQSYSIARSRIFWNWIEQVKYMNKKNNVKQNSKKFFLGLERINRCHCWILAATIYFCSLKRYNFFKKFRFEQIFAYKWRLQQDLYTNSFMLERAKEAIAALTSPTKSDSASKVQTKSPAYIERFQMGNLKSKTPVQVLFWQWATEQISWLNKGNSWLPM